MKNFIKSNILFLLASLLLCGMLVTSDFLLDKSYLKHGQLGIWLLTMILFIVTKKHKQPIAKQCDACGLFVPVDDGKSALKPHCCYMKPKV